MAAKRKGAHKKTQSSAAAPTAPVGGADAQLWKRKEVLYPIKHPPAKRPPPTTTARAKANAPPPPPPPPKPRSKAPLYVAALALHSLAAYGAYVWATASRSSAAEPVPVKALAQQEDSSHVFDEIAQHYDRDIRTSEFFMGLPLLRRSMAKRARGDVLEASAGTGRNTKYYALGGARKVESLTFVDSSAPMLKLARRAFQQRSPDCKHARFVVRDAATPGLRAPSGGKFDTVLQSMGVCSHRSPVQLLRALGEACKPDGTIVLLEHGRSHYAWLNRILDRAADGHAHAWGCWWNRDVEAIVRASGLRVVTLKRYHLGTTYWIEAKPPLRGDAADGGAGEDGGAGKDGGVP